MMRTVRMASDQRWELENFVRKHGEKNAAAALEVSHNTLARAIAGMGIARTTATAIRAKLLEQPKPSA